MAFINLTHLTRAYRKCVRNTYIRLQLGNNINAKPTL